MSKPNPQDRFYSKDHEWIKDDGGGTALIGITDHAQELLTDIVFVELPPIGKKVAAGGTLAVVESVKSVSDVYAPVGCEVIEVNTELENAPELINADAFGTGWIAKVRPDDAAQIKALMSSTDYDSLIREEKQ